MSLWEGFCTLCICSHCNVRNKFPLFIISFLSVINGLVWVALGLYLAVVATINSELGYEKQLFFEKLQTHVVGSKLYFENESSFIFTPLDNLKFYLFAISTIAILGGFGRGIASLCLAHYVRKKHLPYVMSWAWVILSSLALATLGLLAVDVFYTISHNDVSPPHSRDFYFKNDGFGLYAYCHGFKYFFLVDFCCLAYFQWVVRYGQRSPEFRPS